MRPVRAVAFDFNGTLSDDEPVLLAVYQELFSEHGRPLTADEYYGTLAGLSEEVIIGTWLGVDGAELATLVEQRIERYLARCRDGARSVPPCARPSRRRPAGSRSPSSRVRFGREIEPVLAGAGLDRYVWSWSPRTTSSAESPTPPGTSAPQSYSESMRPRSSRSRTRRQGSPQRRRQGCAVSRWSERTPANGFEPRTSSWTRSTRARSAGARVTLVIAHRGACWELPENTLAAFERAIADGADYVEFDVHATSDGELVVCHGRPQGHELRLEEAVDALAGRIGIMCELKTPWRYRRHDVVARTVGLLPEGRDRPLLTHARSSRQRTARAPARGPRHVDPKRVALRVGRRVQRPTRHPQRARQGPVARPPYDRLHGERAGADARAGRVRRGRIFSDRPDLLRRVLAARPD